MIIEKKYLTVKQFMFSCIYYKMLPLIRWDEESNKGYIYFVLLSDGEREIHLFRSKNKKLLDAAWDSVGLIRHALRLVDEVK